MPAPKKSTTKKKAVKPTYLREVEIKFKKKRVKNGSPIGKPVTDSKQVYQLFKDLENEAKEKLITISIDSKMRIICFEVVAIGSVKAVYLRPGEAVRSAVALNAYGIIVIHNHPSGDPAPSKPDKEFTKAIKVVTDSLGYTFHDHIIIGEGEYFSFADAGLME